jgi:peptidyl-prolyl cis-trans isomerase A (cyclophilin A)
MRADRNSSVVIAALALLACASRQSAPPAPRVIELTTPAPETDSATAPIEPRDCTPELRRPKPIRRVHELSPAPDDPTLGQFGLRDAIRGLRGDWPLRVDMFTSAGVLHCELWDQVAPRTVASFVGLARGIRPFKTDGIWRQRPAYDGTSFHRVIRGFVIQGGDPTGTGTAEPGFYVPDEIDESIHADHRGLLYMANKGPDTNGMQFFVLDGAAPHLDGHFTAFGECTPDAVIEAIAASDASTPASRVVIERADVAFANPCRH